VPKNANSQLTLENGLRVLLRLNPSSPSVAVVVLIGVGSRYETIANNGISHFLEHMSFKGTQRRPTTLDIAGEVDGVGGESNAFTGKEYTGYYIKVASKELPLAIDLLEDTLFHSLYQSEECDREKNVILEEINMYHDSPQDQVSEMYDQLVYPDQPLGMEIAGTAASLKNIGHDQLADFVHSWYTPNNMIVGIAGQFDPHQAQQLVDQAFSKHQSHPIGHYQPVKIEQHQPQLALHKKATDQTQLIVGLRSYASNHPHRYALALLNVVLGGNMSSRLFTQVRERRGLAYAVHSNVDDYLDTGSLICQAGMGHHNAEQTLQVILRQLADMRDNGVTERELAQAKQYLRGRLALSMEDSLGMAIFHARQWLLEGQVQTIDDILTEVDRVDLDLIRQVAKDVCVPQGLNLSAIGPNLEEADLRQLLDI
jgi:predicted Zn-dependent peptidase